MKRISVLIPICFFAGCMPSGYQQFYKPYLDVQTLTDVELLQEGQEPQIFGTDDFDRDIRSLISKNYLVVGQSSFNGAYEDTKNAQRQAKRVGATVVLANAKYTNTQTINSALFLPDNKTTYHSGTGTARTTYADNYGLYGNANTNMSYSGTSTTYGTQVVPITMQQQRYDQIAVYLVKSTKRPRFGLRMIDLPYEMRSELGRNVGALVDIVLEDSPAFYSNVLPGDVIISIDGQAVIRAEHAIRIMQAVPQTASSAQLTVIRKGKEEKINVNLAD